MQIQSTQQLIQPTEVEATASPQGKNPKGLRPSNSEEGSELSTDSFAGAMAWIASGIQQPTQANPLASLLEGGQIYSRSGEAKQPQVDAANLKPQGAVEIPLGMNTDGNRVSAADLALISRAMNAAQEKSQSQSMMAGKSSPFVDVKSELEKRNDIRSNGVLTDALIAGPSEPWKSNWVFGDRLSEARMKADSGAAASMNSLSNIDMSKIMEAMGGDESQIRTGARSLDALVNHLGDAQVVASASQHGNRLMSGEDFMNSIAQRQFQNSSAQLKSSDGIVGQPGAISIDPGRLGALRPKNDSSESSFGGSMNEQSQHSLTAGSMASLMNNKIETAMQSPPVVTGNVVPGSMMKDRLTSESLLNMSNSISGMKNAGGGEMKIRLNPDHLGELVIRVTTQGNQVGLKVHATKNEAKRILEESISSLKDSLMGQNLQLSKMDIAVMPSKEGNETQANSGGMNWDKGSQNAGMNDSRRETNAEQSSERGLSGDSRVATKRASLTNVNSQSSNAQAAAGRLDVRA